MDDHEILQYQKDLFEVTTLKKGLKSLKDAMDNFEEVISYAEEAMNDLKSLPPFKADYKKFHWIATKYDQLDDVIGKLGAVERNDEFIDVSSLFEEDDLENQDASYKRACTILKKYKSRDEHFEESSEMSFNESCGNCSMRNSTMLFKKEEESENWKEDLFGVSFLLNERFAKKRRPTNNIDPDKVTSADGFVELAFSFGNKPNPQFVYTCDELGSFSVDNEFVEFAHLFEKQESLEEDNYEDIDELLVLLPEKSDKSLEEKLELPANISEFPFKFEEHI